MNALKGAMFLVTLLFHIFIFNDSSCLAEPSNPDLVSVNFGTRLSPTFIKYWNSHSIAFDKEADSNASLLAELDNSSISAALIQANSGATELICVGQVELADDSLYQLEASWSIGEDGVMHSITLRVVAALNDSEEPSFAFLSSLENKSSSVEKKAYKRALPSVAEASVYAGGSGTEDDPYLIATGEDLIALSVNSAHWNKHFLQTGNIIFSSDYVSEDWNGDGLMNSNDIEGMQPIGTKSVPFSGSYDGGNSRIKYMLIDNGDEYAGMFGYCKDATLTNIGLASIYVYGWHNVGALVGYCKKNNTISKCYSTGSVSGLSYVGGLIGGIGYSTTVDQCISTCKVDGFLYAGGLIGRSQGSDVTISNSVSAGSVDGFVFTAGLIGSSGSATVENVYSSTEVVGTVFTGGLIGNSSSGTVTDAYWDVEASGVSSSSGGDVEGLTSEEMSDSTIFADWDTTVWTFDPEVNDGMPVIEEQSDFYEPIETEYVGTGTWDEAENWTNGVPDEEEITTAIISGECNVDDPIEVENLIIENGGVLTIGEEGDLDVEEELTIECDSVGSGEFHPLTEVGTDTVEQEKFFAGGEWTFISMPFTLTADSLFPNLNLAATWTDPLGDYWISEYSENKRALSGSGMYHIFDGNSLLQAGKGYMVWVDADQVGVYKHIVSTIASSVETDFSSNYAMNNSGWNLVGNPFTYTMTYSDIFDCPYNKANYTGAVYLWDGLGYKTWVDGVGDFEASKIHPLEAFFVKRKFAGNGYFCMAKGDCQCTATEVKSSSVTLEEKIEVLGVRVALSGAYDKTYLRVTTGDVIGKEAIKFELTNAQRPIVYSTREDDLACAVNVVKVDEECNIPLVVNLQEDQATFEMSFTKTESKDYIYTLFDARDEETFVINDEEPLLLPTYGEKYISDRFSIKVELRSSSVTTGMVATDLPEVSLVSVKTVEDDIMVQSLVNERVSVDVFTLDGNLQTRFQLSALEQKQLELKKGIYIINFKSKEAQETQKVLHF